MHRNSPVRYTSFLLNLPPLVYSFRMGHFCAAVFLFLASSAALAAEILQSEFNGPISLNVWKHIEPSWNVEISAQSPPQFTLRRGRSGAGATARGFIELRFHSLAEEGLRARFSGKAYVRTGPFDNRLESIELAEASSTIVGKSSVFRLQNDAFVDAPGKRIVTEIEFEIFQADASLFRFGVLPMYARGPQTYYHQNVIDPYRVNASSGNISVASESSNTLGLDIWNGQEVAPVLNTIDSIRLDSGARLGLHRHEKNQELWLVQSGQFAVIQGVAKQTSSERPSTRQWDASGNQKQTTEFSATGWVEQRILGPRELTIIVPEPKSPSTVCFHGLLALTDGNYLSMGTEN